MMGSMLIIDPNKGKKIIQCGAEREQLLYEPKVRNSMTLGNTVKAVKSQMVGQGRTPRVGFTNGKFRYLHPAHCVFLNLCKTRCDILIVAINGDYSLRVLGEKSPFDQKERAFALASLNFVDYITIFNEENPYLCIGQVDPDVIFKGPDYKDKEVISAGKPVEIIEHPFCVHASDLEEEHAAEKRFKHWDV